MGEHDSSVELEEKQAAVWAVGKLAHLGWMEAQTADGNEAKTRLTAISVRTRNIPRSKQFVEIRGSNSVVECHLAKVDVEGSSPVSRSG